MKEYIPVLSIAGSDSSGGAGIQADLKTFAALGCYGMTVITATTAQNTKGVTAIHSIPPAHIKEQLLAIMDDIKPKAIKIGMLDRPEVVDVLVGILIDFPDIPIVFDPVMVSTSGFKLIQDETIKAIREKLFPLVSLLTPNMDETSILFGKEVNDIESMKAAGASLLQELPEAILIKGGHLKESVIHDLLYSKSNGLKIFKSEKITSQNVHGTGCSLSAAIAVGLALGKDMENAVCFGRDYVNKAIFYGKDVKTGNGNGPLNHFFNPQKQIINEMD
ncbi:bifunctional hydroxymethylpyrimidine kinase/phosphomethylpyrimidine kinase [Belliella sp. R4-6]|uniref:hydroxymethylpyrimidine kinase n=1 Tax=Belliella alkalica TaxID=1730871 RepID=A0ABS9VBY6_9BACT|nr:bifunctional hydroxymethylpyrimidine kinase/phosphomethylpyrimidine kinase [Belliella alkalica]MCH7413944.1 bifunctional hydroxymethylpyrimidine kinase/phosphomethylpyrimidine kinase [Belliella alkalica]